MQLLALAAVVATMSVPHPGVQCRRIIQDASVEKVERCEEKLTARRGRAWLETETRISRRSVDLTREAAEPHVVLPWVDTGTAATAKLPFDEQEQIEWFAAEGAFRRYARPRERVRLPVGTAIAVARIRGAIVAVSRPLTIRLGVAEEARWDPAGRDATQVIALLTWPPNEHDDAQRPASLALASDASRNPPDVLFDTDEVLLAIWNRATAGAQRIELQSQTVYLPDGELDVRRVKLNVFEKELRPLPSLVVSAGPEADEDWPALDATIRDAATGATLREAPVRLGEPLLIEHLPPRQLQVTLAAGKAWRFALPADLRLTEQGSVDFALAPFHVTGELLEGERRVQGTVSFRSEERWFAVETDEEGRFAFDAWSAGRYIYEARAAGGDARAPAYSSTIVLSASASEIAIRLPSEKIRVRVSDAGTGAPLKDAAVTMRNTWIDPAEGQRRFASRFVADANGEVVLPPMHAGEADLMVQAPGYVPEEQKIVLAEGTDRLVRVALQREETSAVRIALPSGAPAIGAEAVAFAQGTMTAWRGTADDSGRLEVPNRFRGAFLVIRHRDAASAAVLFDDVLLARGSVRLQPPAPELHVRAENRGDANPGVVIWLDGVRLDASTTAFAVWAPLPFVDHNGIWRARNLPPNDVRIFVTSPLNLARARSGAFDAMFVVIRYPWRDVIPVPTAE